MSRLGRYIQGAFFSYKYVFGHRFYSDARVGGWVSTINEMNGIGSLIVVG